MTTKTWFQKSSGGKKVWAGLKSRLPQKNRRRFIWIIMMVVGCTLLLWIPQSVHSQQNSRLVYLPAFENNEAVVGQTEPAEPAATDLLTVRGTMVSTGVPFDQGKLLLWRYNPNDDIPAELFRVRDISLGTPGNVADYQFGELARLEPGFFYSVVYVNHLETPGHLGAWFTSASGNPETGTVIVLPTFDIADITLTNPDAGATKSMPEDFRWNARSTSTDSYQMQILERNADGDIVRTAQTALLRHPTSSFFAGSLEDIGGFETDVEYGWRMWVYDGLDGRGYSREERAITFRDIQAASAPSSPTAPTVFTQTQPLETVPPVDFSSKMDAYDLLHK